MSDQEVQEVEQAEGSEQTATEINQSDNTEGSDDRLKQLEETNARLLRESKVNAEKYREIRDANEKRAHDEAKATGKKDDLIEILEKNVQTEKERNSELKKKMLTTELRSQVRKYANDAHKIDTVIDELKNYDVTLDDEQLRFSGVKEAIEEMRKKDTWIFKQKEDVQTVTARPNVKVKTGDAAYVDEMRKAKTQKEFDLIRKKYGRA